MEEITASLSYQPPRHYMSSIDITIATSSHPLDFIASHHHLDLKASNPTITSVECRPEAADGRHNRDCDHTTCRQSVPGLSIR